MKLKLDGICHNFTKHKNNQNVHCKPRGYFVMETPNMKTRHRINHSVFNQ